MSKFIFFNSSMPRSGSTLLQNVLNQNPKIYATPTDGSLELLYGARINYTESPEFKAQNNELMLKAWRGFCNGAINGYCNALTERPYVCIKSRGIGIHYKWYSAFMNNDIKVICMVRNLKSIYSSMEKIFRSNYESHQKIQNHAQMQGTTTAKRVDIWTNSQPIGLALERFRQMFDEGISSKCLFVRMEDFTSNPANEMSKIYAYLCVEPFLHNFDNVEQTTQEDDAVYGLTPTLHVIRRKIESPRQDYYEILGRDICKWIDDRFHWYQDAFGYKK